MTEDIRRFVGRYPNLAIGIAGLCLWILSFSVVWNMAVLDVQLRESGMSFVTITGVVAPLVYTISATLMYVGLALTMFALTAVLARDPA